MLLGASVAGALLCAPAQAAEQAWEHTLAIYMVGSSINGTAGAGPLDVDVDVSFSDILDNFDAGVMFAYRAERGPWAFVADLAYLGLEGDKKSLGPLGRTRADLEADQLLLAVTMGYALNDRWSAYGGVRYWDLDADLSLAVAGEELRSASVADDWIDPLVGLRYAAPLGGKWSLIATGDIGGFGVGSDFSWTATALAVYQINRNAHVLFGYRHIDVDYEDGNGADRFKWDVWEGGPSAGFAWKF
jgi:hypothetical protein